MPSRRFFLYGTLQPRAGTRMSEWIAERLIASQPAIAPGRLFAIKGGNGWFPALLPVRGPGTGGGTVSGTGGDTVSGTLCEIDCASGDLALLDRYEGREYRRAIARVQGADRVRRTAQIYVWRAPLPRGAEPIAGGDFLGWLATTRRRAFSESSGDST